MLDTGVKLLIENNFNKESFFKQMQGLNIKKSDTLFINCNLEKLGIIQGFKRMDYLNLFLDYLGEDGTLVALAYTGAGRSIFNNENIPYFDGTQKANTGAFSNIMLKHLKATRSMHPSNSIVVIGKNAEYITKNHNENSGAYSFIKQIIELDAKVLLIGMSNFPGFVTHKVEEDLQLYKQYWDRFLLKVKLKNGKIFYRKDPGGCSSTFGRLYQYYIKEEKLLAGYINNTYSLSINAKDAYDIDMKIIKNNPNILICDNPNCYRCRVSRWKTIWRVPFFIVKKVFQKYVFKRG
ncbi:MAG: AAC(3) family N-acetyltransferase [Campylobacterota bacterium]|nr:AAC(3) family N-acetyltransferase [Campylobacterota bacterium]